MEDEFYKHNVEIEIDGETFILNTIDKESYEYIKNILENERKNKNDTIQSRD